MIFHYPVANFLKKVLNPVKGRPWMHLTMKTRSSSQGTNVQNLNRMPELSVILRIMIQFFDSFLSNTLSQKSIGGLKSETVLTIM